MADDTILRVHLLSGETVTLEWQGPEHPDGTSAAALVETWVEAPPSHIFGTVYQRPSLTSTGLFAEPPVALIPIESVAWLEIGTAREEPDDDVAF